MQKPRVYYNEIDPAAAHVLRCLIRGGVIAPGIVDERSIKDVQPEDLIGFTQCHFFAGGGIWSVAARLAGWPDDRPLWTGSCPCQGESIAGKKLGADDPRHLWPDFFRLIRACRPTDVVGEQVARAAGTHWLDRVWLDMEDGSYAFRPVVIPACAVDAPHIRERIYWLARDMGKPDGGRRAPRQQASEAVGFGSAAIAASGLGDAKGLGRRGRQDDEDGWRRQRASSDSDSRSIKLGNANSEHEIPIGGVCEGPSAKSSRGSIESFWAGAERLAGADGKARRVEPGIRLLANGVPGRVAQLRIGGNAIVAPLAAEVLRAYLETEELV